MSYLYDHVPLTPPSDPSGTFSLSFSRKFWYYGTVILTGIICVVVNNGDLNSGRMLAPLDHRETRSHRLQNAGFSWFEKHRLG